MAGKYLLIETVLSLHTFCALLTPRFPVGEFFCGVRLMRQLKVECYPNREIRVVTTRMRTSVRDPFSFYQEKDCGESSLVNPHLSLEENSPTSNSPTETLQKRGERPGFGGLPRRQQFSTYARRTILRAGGALEREHPHSECLFLTLTLPGSTREAFEAMARYSALAVQLLHRWLSNHIASKLSIYTWEWQRRGALHLHYVVHCPDKDRGQWIIHNLKSQWIRILDRISCESGVDMYRKHSGFSWSSNKEITRTDAQWCEKSVAAYLSKYVSKAVSPTKGARFAFYPSRWYGVSRPLLQLLREHTFSTSLEYLRSRDAWAMYEDCLSVLSSYSLKCYEYKHVVGDGKTIVSYLPVHEQASIWQAITMNILPATPSSSMSTERNMRRLVANGSILLRRHRTWLSEFTKYYGSSRSGNLLRSSNFEDISRSDLVFLVDSLAYSFRSHQRLRFELPGDCKLWYSQMKRLIESAPPDDKEWIGYLEL